MALRRDDQVNASDMLPSGSVRHASLPPTSLRQAMALEARVGSLTAKFGVLSRLKSHLRG
jgi:hypothetical protein